MEIISTLIGLGLLGGIGYALHKSGVFDTQAAVNPTGAIQESPVTQESASWPKRLNRQQVYSLAKSTVNQFGLKADPLMLTAMADIESDFDRFAHRNEPHINDASYGLMQTLYGTASWLYDDMGYRGKPLNGPADLYDPAVSMYFGAAYVDWLVRTYGGTEEQIVRRYNGGPKGDERTATLAHYAKYEIAKALTQQEVFNYG